ncbi:MAG: MOSC domain-containing protein [Silvibacterium sp.]|nr:MOSC domain-containing protein [Silvibacterium sp.]
MAISSGRLLSVNVGAPQEFELQGQLAKSAIWKSPVTGRVAVRGVNLDGDDQADRKVHGGYDKAVYAFANEDICWWQHELGRPLGFGEFGENLTTEGIDVNGAVIGERWQIGTTVLEVSEPRGPCWKLGFRMNDPLFPRRFTDALRPGSYLRIVVEGTIGAGDEIRILSRPDHGLTIRDVSRIYYRDRGEATRLLGNPHLSDSWSRWATDYLQAIGRPSIRSS